MRAAGREPGDRAMVVDRCETGFGVAARGDVDLQAPLDDADAVSGVDGAARVQGDRARQVGIARRGPGVLAVRDDDRLAVGRRARLRRHARRSRVERACNCRRSPRALDPVSNRVTRGDQCAACGGDSQV